MSRRLSEQTVQIAIMDRAGHFIERHVRSDDPDIYSISFENLDGDDFVNNRHIPGSPRFWELEIVKKDGAAITLTGHVTNEDSSGHTTFITFIPSHHQEYIMSTHQQIVSHHNTLRELEGALSPALWEEAREETSAAAVRRALRAETAQRDLREKIAAYDDSPMMTHSVNGDVFLVRRTIVTNVYDDDLEHHVSKEKEIVYVFIKADDLWYGTGQSAPNAVGNEDLANWAIDAKIPVDAWEVAVNWEKANEAQS